MRAIDKYEDAILQVLELCDHLGGSKLMTACDSVGDAWKMSSDRLVSLVRTWCAIGGFKVPS